MPLGRGDLFFDQMEVVEQPLAGRGDPVVRRYRGGQLFADLDQHGFVRGQPREEPVPRTTRRQPMRGRERLAVPLHLLGAEQFRAKRQLLTGRLVRQTAGAQTSPELRQMPKNRRAARHRIALSILSLSHYRGHAAVRAATGPTGLSSPPRLIHDVAIAAARRADESIPQQSGNRVQLFHTLRHDFDDEQMLSSIRQARP